MSEDFYTASARQRLERINAERAAAQADLAAYRANADYDSAGQAIQQIANLDAEQANLGNLYNRYVASQQPRRPEFLTPEERQARPIEKMGWSDAVELARTSRYAKNIKSDDPNMLAGYYEAQRRKARGE
jgi:hypothetical protein